MYRTRVPVVLALLLGACIPSFGEDPVDERGPEAVAAASEGGALSVALDMPADIDPGNVHTPEGSLIVRTFCDTLVMFDPVTNEPRPALAQSWTITRGGSKLFLKLRPGARFHDGREVTADDVAFSLSRVASQDFASASASLLAPIAGYAIVHGDADSENPRLRQELAGVSAADKHTVEITLDEPRADFIRVLGHPVTSPVSRAAVEADASAFVRQPVCAGPYRVAAPYEQGRPLVLERFGDYHGNNVAFTNGGAGYADRITFGARARGSDVARVEAGARAPGVVRATGGRVEFLGLPTSTEPFDDPRVREAISRSLDRRALARAVAGRAPARGILPPGLSGRPAACGAAAPLAPDPAGARALLRDAGVDPRAVAAPLYFNDAFGNRAVVEAVAAQVHANVGIRLEPTPVPFDRILELGRSQSGIDGAFRFGWEAAYPGHEPFLVPLFDDSAIGADNISRFDSASFADVLDLARRTIDDDERADAYGLLENVVCREMPMIPVTVDERAFRVRSRVGGARGTVLDMAAADPIVRELFVRAG